MNALGRNMSNSMLEMVTFLRGMLYISVLVRIYTVLNTFIGISKLPAVYADSAIF